jgi:hypothetical protein
MFKGILENNSKMKENDWEERNFNNSFTNYIKNSKASSSICLQNPCPTSLLHTQPPTSAMDCRQWLVPVSNVMPFPCLTCRISLQLWSLPYIISEVSLPWLLKLSSRFLLHLWSFLFPLFLAWMSVFACVPYLNSSHSTVLIKLQCHAFSTLLSSKL